MDRDAIVLTPGLAATDGWARRHAALWPGVALVAMVVWAMYALLKGSQSVALPELVFLPLGLAITALLIVAAIGLVLALEGSLAADHARRVAPVDLALAGDEAIVRGGRLDGRRIAAAELASARTVEKQRPGRGIWRNLKDVVLQRARDRVADEAYLELVVTLDGAPTVIAEAVDARAQAGLRAIHAWMTSPRPIAPAAVRAQVARRHGVRAVPSGRGLGRRLAWARGAMTLAYPAVAAAAWALGARPSLLAAVCVLAGGLAVIGLAWALVRPGAIARAAAQEELAAAAGEAAPATSRWRRARGQAWAATFALTAAIAGSAGGLALAARARSSPDARACAAGDHAACTRRARALERRDPAAAIALLAPACEPPTAPTAGRCLALASIVASAAPPHRDLARAETLYRATCALGDRRGCSLRQVLCGKPGAPAGCAAVPAERAP
jgi:hypothetical protein